MSVTVVSGIPGVGVSRVCQLARRELDEGYHLVNVGDVMLEAALERGLTTDRDELGRLPAREQRLLQRRAAEEIARRARESNLLVSTHLVVRTEHGFLPGFDATTLADVDPDRFVVVDADAAQIAARRDDAEHRRYGAEDEATIGFQQQLQAAAATNYAISTGAPVQYLRNETDPADAAAELVAVVESIGK
jgi:adenylate kinase